MPVRVLIVEDEPLIRMLIRDLLEEEGFDCADCACRRRRESRPMERRHGGAAGGVKSGHW
jgi:DNA-binding response OmpR family regulator